MPTIEELDNHRVVAGNWHAIAPGVRVRADRTVSQQFVGSTLEIEGKEVKLNSWQSEELAGVASGERID